MKPEDLVPDFATCKALKERGFPQEDTYFVHYHYGHYHYGKWYTGPRKTSSNPASHIASPTLQEVLDQMTERGSADGYIRMAQHLTDADIMRCVLSKHPAQAAALLWIEMHDEGRKKQNANVKRRLTQLLKEQAEQHERDTENVALESQMGEDA